MKNKYFISSIIPVYNGEKFLAPAIESIIKQSYSPIEIIIIDDGSTDATAEVVKNFKDQNIIYIYQPNSGAPVARNKGLSMAKGNIISFLDADDLWPIDKLKLQ